MEFGIDKCSKANFKGGKLTKATNLDLDINNKIKKIDQDGTYKYLGIKEIDGIQHSIIKKKIRKEYYKNVFDIRKRT